MAESNATASNRARKLPIVIVPGTMGSRLTDPVTDKIVWNPTGFPISPLKSFFELDNFAANLGRMQQKDPKGDLIPLEPDRHVFDIQRLEKPIAHIRHFHTVIRAFYGKLALELDKRLRKPLAQRGLFPLIYCAGYDFRVGNDDSASTLSRVVREAQDECDGEKVTIIAHSMGGIVTRFFSKNMGGEDKVKQVFLLASPTMGAPDAYFTLRNGLERSAVRLLVFGEIFTGTDSRRFARNMPSVYQLLPTVLYGKVDPKWLTFDPAHTGISRVTQSDPIAAMQFKDCSNSVLLLLDLYTGLMGEIGFRDLSDKLYSKAVQLDTSLAMPSGAAYMHPNTTLVFTRDLKTATQGEASYQGETSFGGVSEVTSTAELTKVAAGDETVPAISASPERIEPAAVLRKEFSGVSHQDIPSTEAVIAFLVDRILTSNPGAP